MTIPPEYPNDRLALMERYRAREQPPRATVTVSHEVADTFVSIEGMVQDLRHWEPPPGLTEEQRIGFASALLHVERYLAVRQRHAQRLRMVNREDNPTEA